MRSYSLARRVAANFDQILVTFSDSNEPPSPELLELYLEVIVVRRQGTHLHPSALTPDVVQDFDCAGFRAALRQAIASWGAPIVQMEFTQMAQYSPDCSPATTVLVEHDVTLDLYRQMAIQCPDWDTIRQFKLWCKFEKRAWARVDCVVTMSARDRAMIPNARAVVLPNGVDLDRFREPSSHPEGRRLLFIGSFSHLPNLLAMKFFMDEVWPLLSCVRLHVIAGSRHKFFLSHYGNRASLDLNRIDVEVEDFVADVRPAYERAAVVIAPLQVSAGTNLKILEAMAMGKPVVSTPVGVNGLDLTSGEDFILVETANEMADAIESLMSDPSERARIGSAARYRVERQYSWDEIARQQAELYFDLLKCAGRASTSTEDQGCLASLSRRPAER